MIEDVEKYLDDIENKRCTQSSETKIKTLLDFQEKLEGLNIQPQQLNHFNERIVVACEEITNMKTTEVKFKAEKTQNGAASNKVAHRIPNLHKSCHIARFCSGIQIPNSCAGSIQ